jgi:hypothetical protein
MAKPAAGQPLSIYAEERVARAAEAVARAENRKVAQLGGEALTLWVELPASARAALRYIRGLGATEDVQLAYREMTRAVLAVQRAMLGERATEELRAQFTLLDGALSDDEITARAVELSHPPTRQRSGERRQPAPGTASPSRGQSRARARKAR